MRTLPWEYAVRNLGRSPLRLVLSVGGSALVVTCCALATLLRIDWESRQLMRGFKV